MMTAEQKPHILPVRVYYEDTDAANIVYYANYLKFAERARTEYLRAIGWSRAQAEKELGILFIVRHVEISYLASAKLDDALEVRTVVDSVGNTSMTMAQEVWRGDKRLAEMKVVLVAINLKGHPVRFPPQLRQIESLAVSP